MLDSQLIQKIKLLDNIKIDFDLSKINSYDWAHFADLVIGKSTAIVEECFAAHKKIIICDEEKYISSFSSYPIHKLSLSVINYEELKKQINLWLDNHYMNEKDIHNYQDTYLNLPKQDPSIILKDTLKNILED